MNGPGDQFLAGTGLPIIRTFELVGATVSICFSTLRIAELFR